VSTGAHPSTFPALHYDKCKEERRKKVRITPLQAEEPLASSSEGGRSRKQRNREAAMAVEKNQEQREQLHSNFVFSTNFMGFHIDEPSVESRFGMKDSMAAFCFFKPLIVDFPTPYSCTNLVTHYFGAFQLL
jgi:hypothetical protein